MPAGAETHKERGRRLVLRYAALQMAVTALVAAAAFAVAGLAAARAALVGGLVVAIGNVVFGWALFQPGIAPVRVLARAVYAGEVLKWLWVGLALWGALAVAHLAPLPLLLGLIAAQFGFWIGIAVIR
jgi:F0F1-type ATP synthase assembly protein I